ncbi:iron uptake porin [Pantanalinema rosaneae CENA516]|uniref:iron uptake porin n=1 Tax=Pantanalinema rosaneae TaxID=1620701 RepID=UPI003D6E6573
MLPILPPEPAPVVVVSTSLANLPTAAPPIESQTLPVSLRSPTWSDPQTVNTPLEVPLHSGSSLASPDLTSPTVESVAHLEFSTIQLPSEQPSDLVEEQSVQPLSQLPEPIPPADIPATPTIATTPDPAVTSGLIPQFSTASLDHANTANPDSPESAPESDHGAMDQVTSVSQLTDVQPTDWAFSALQSLVERYGCIAGYPDRRFRGNQAITRDEFAAGLNACLDRVSATIASATDPLVGKADLLTLQRLQEEFSGELGVLRGRVDALTARTATLENQQFSRTATLGGRSIFALSGAAGGEPPGRGETNTTFNYLTQLQIASSFTGRDILRVGLSSANAANGGFANPDALNTRMALLSFQGDLNNQVYLDSLEYRFAVSDRLVVIVQPEGFGLSNVLSPNSILADAGQGTISRFAEFSPLLRIGNLDAGVGFDWLISDRWRLQFGYGTRDANQPNQGVFGDHHAFGTQLLYKPSSAFMAGFHYINAYSSDARLDTFTGSNNADISGGFNEQATIHAIGTSMQWRLSPKVILGAWGGLVVADSRESDAATLASTYLVSLGLRDPFGRQGDLWGFVLGQPLKLHIGYLIERFDEATSLHLETFYRWRVNDNISITPGIFVVTHPGHISDNNTIVIGTLRTTFSF